MILRYDHPEWFETIEKPVLEKASEIFLWGAGKIATVVAHAIEKRGLDFAGFVDIAQEKQGTMYYDHIVISPEELYANHRNAMVIVSCAFTSVLDDLKKNGMDAWDAHSLVSEVDMEGYRGTYTFEYLQRMVKQALSNFAAYYKVGLPINALYVMVTDKCSLKCKNCDGLIPYYSNPQNDSYEDIVESYNNILDVCGSVDKLNVFGGEPLLHPDIVKIVDYFAKDERCGVVSIISNGTITPRQDLIKVMKNPKVVLRISDYGKWSRKRDEIEEVCKAEGINLEITNYEYWDRIPKIQRTNETPEELDYKYAMCTTNYLYVKHKKIFHCVFAAAVSSFSEDVIPDFERNYVEVKEGNKKELSAFIRQLINKKHIDACKYCPGGHCIQWEEKVPVAEQAKCVLPRNELYANGRGID